MKILSFNVRIWTRDCNKSSVHYWKARMEKMCLMLEELDPDIICFQELMFPATLYIPLKYKRVGLSTQHPIYVKKGMKASGHQFKIFMDTAIIKDFRLINVHSRWERQIIEKNCRQIEGLAKDNEKVIVCGDFNNGEGRINLPSLEHVDYKKDDDTFVNFNRPTESHGVIDHFYVKGIKAKDIEIITQYGQVSDHYPILFEF